MKAQKARKVEITLPQISENEMEKAAQNIFLKKYIRYKEGVIRYSVSIHTFQLAVRDGLIRNNPTDGVMREIKKSHAWEREKRHALTIEQQKAVSDFLDTHPDYRGWRPIITILLGTGIRIGECLGLRWCDVDLEKNKININYNLVYRKNLQGKCVYTNLNQSSNQTYL